MSKYAITYTILTVILTMSALIGRSQDGVLHSYLHLMFTTALPVPISEALIVCRQWLLMRP